MNILVAGASGYLGSHIVTQLLKTSHEITALARSVDRLPAGAYRKIEADVTNRVHLQGVMKGVDVVITTIGITRQKDGLTYMDVDYQANKNLMDEARNAGVRKFIYVSVFNGEKLRHLKICEAKERFVDELIASGMEYCIVRPTGYFSDMKDFLDMANRGAVYLFGDGEFKLNPIDGGDLATEVIKIIPGRDKELIIGGPVTYTQNQIGQIALEALNKPERIVHLPDWIREFVIWSLRTFTPQRVYGPLEFFLTAMAQDNEAPKYGRKALIEFYKEVVDSRMS